MSKARGGGRRSAAAMVRGAEGLQMRPSAERLDAAGFGGEAADAGDAAVAAAAQPVASASDPSASGPDAGAQGNLPLPAERRRWDSLVNYPGDTAGPGDAGA